MRNILFVAVVFLFMMGVVACDNPSSYKDIVVTELTIPIYFDNVVDNQVTIIRSKSEYKSFFSDYDVDMPSIDFNHNTLIVARGVTYRGIVENADKVIRCFWNNDTLNVSINIPVDFTFSADPWCCIFLIDDKIRENQNVLLNVDEILI
jgi:hypothetical protein